VSRERLTRRDRRASLSACQRGWSTPETARQGLMTPIADDSGRSVSHPPRGGLFIPAFEATLVDVSAKVGGTVANTFGERR
jgi:hypothetical protein